jgi:hemerythrin-like domain-containing protein
MSHLIVGSPGDDSVEKRLLDCHEKIRKFLAAATRLASDENASDADARATAGAVARYFEEALPQHSRDEDLSLRPRLEAAGYMGDLAALAREHDAIDAIVARLVPMWRELESSACQRHELVEQMAPEVATLTDLFERHLAWEEEHLIPRLGELLGAQGLAEVLAEMKARRTPR